MRKRPSIRWAVALIGFAVTYIGMFFAGNEQRRFAMAGLEALPLVILAMLAYTGQEKPRAKVLTIGYWLILIAGIILVVISFTVLGFIDPQLYDKLQTSAQESSDVNELLSPEVIRGVLLAILAASAAAMAGLLCFIPIVRRQFARLFDIDPTSFVHATALATVVATTFLCLIPLAIVKDPPLLFLARFESLRGAEDAGGQLRSAVYGLIWAVPASILAVGYSRKRNFWEACRRLSLEWPSRRQVIFAFLMTAVLVPAMTQLDSLITRTWHAMGWRMTDPETMRLLFGFALGPVAATIVALTAGIGEELVFRGVLQPRFGILLPSLMFASIHAFQYNFDAVIQVLVLGLIFGVVRYLANTTTSALVHAAYDFLLLIGEYVSG